MKNAIVLSRGGHKRSSGAPARLVTPTENCKIPLIECLIPSVKMRIKEAVAMLKCPIPFVTLEILYHLISSVRDSIIRYNWCC